MKSGGRTQVGDVNVGRQILCREATNTRPTSQCARKLKQTVAVATRGLNAQQRLLWRRMVYVPALFEASRFSHGRRNLPRCFSSYGACPTLTREQWYNQDVAAILSNTLKFDGLYGGKHKWSQYLVWGATLVKKMPLNRASYSSVRTPVRRPAAVRRSTPLPQPPRALRPQRRCSVWAPPGTREACEDRPRPRPVPTSRPQQAPRQGIGTSQRSLSISAVPGTVTFWSGGNGRLFSATLSCNQAIQGMAFPWGAQVIFDEQGHLGVVRLPHAHVIRGVVYAATSASSSDVYFHSNGRVRTASLALNQTIKGLYCARSPSGQGGFTTIEFYANGSIKSAVLASRSRRRATSQRIQGVYCQGSIGAVHRGVEFHRNGVLKSAISGRRQRVNGLLLPKGSIVSFDNRKRVVNVVLQKPATLRGVKCDRGSVSFYRSGKLKAATLAVPQTIRGIPFARGNISFHKSGHIASATLARKVTIGGIVCAPGEVSLNSNGSLSAFAAGAEQSVGGEDLAVGVRYEFDDRGVPQTIVEIDVD